MGNLLGLLRRPTPLGRTSAIQPIGLLAGAGRFPIRIAEKARSLGIPVVCIAVRNMAPPELTGICDRIYWTGMGKMGYSIRTFVREEVSRFTMAGKFHKIELMKPGMLWHHLPDWRAIRFWINRAR